MKNIKSVSIIGLGSFGVFLAHNLSKAGLVVTGCDPNIKYDIGVKIVDLQKAAKSDMIIISVPLARYPELLSQLNDLIKPKTLVMDVCSVKVKPARLFNKYLPNHPNILLSHPLFGPQTASKTLKGHKLIVTNINGKIADEAVYFFKVRLGLNVQVMTSDEHDKMMAQIHALTFFIARGLSNLNISKNSFITPSFKMIADLVDFDKMHSEELFMTVQMGNPYAEDIRNQIVDNFINLRETLQSASE